MSSDARAALRFFFQAEDGIRDKLVTGVQTCALPIFEISSLGVDSPAAAVELGALFDDKGGGGEVAANVCGAAEYEFLAREDVAFDGAVDLCDCDFDHCVRDLSAGADDQCAVG